jgi:hypothetical protein
MRREPVDQHEAVGHPLVLQRGFRREFLPRARGDTDPQLRASALKQTEKRAAAPILGRLALVCRTVFDQLSLAAVTLAAPAGGTAFMHRMQRVDDDDGARDRQPRFDGAPAEAVEQRRLALAGQPGLGRPAAKLG